jgi:hypothetical protein
VIVEQQQEIVLPRTRSRRRTLPPIMQAAALQGAAPSPLQQKLSALGDRIAELRASIAALQARLDLSCAALRATATAPQDR